MMLGIDNYAHVGKFQQGRRDIHKPRISLKLDQWPSHVCNESKANFAPVTLWHSFAFLRSQLALSIFSDIFIAPTH